MRERLRNFAGEVQRALFPTFPDEALGGRIRGEQIRAVLRLTPLAFFANVANAAVTAYALHGLVSSLALAVWALPIVAAAIIPVRGWFLLRKRESTRPASARAIRVVTRNAALLGVLWGALSIVFFHQVDTQYQLLIACVVSGMMFGGAFVLASVPSAAIAYVGVMTLEAAVPLIQGHARVYADLLGLLVIYSVVLMISVVWNSRMFVERLLAEAAREQQTEWMKLLLKDFEEKASDWLWEIDGICRLKHVSKRFAQILGRATDELQDANFLELMTPASRRNVPTVGAFKQAIKSRRLFHDLTICIDVNGEEQWWMLTGSPIFDARGEFAGFRGVGSDITVARRAEEERRSAIERIAHMAHHDTLTNLPNRASFNEHLEQTLDRSTPSQSSFAVFSMDLDRFKEVNDLHGHPLGDAVLTILTDRMRKAANGAFLARLGGDEFALVAVNAGEESATALAAELMRSITGDIEVEGFQFQLGVSIGVALFPRDGKDARELLANADAALYRAKAEGRRAIRFFDSDMDMQLREKRALQADLRKAVEDHQLVLDFQPQARMDGEIVGFEALVRWQHPTRGLIPPGAFISVAEESGLIEAIGGWVLREACREAAAWSRKLQIAVNVSPVQFRRGDLPTLVHTVLLETGLTPSRLVLEVTENVLIVDFSRAQSTLRRLKALGVQIALDDFGTGYSSLSYLQSFPFDKIKIDQSFVCDVERNMQSAAIVRSVVNLARSLNVPVVAEGVETEAQRLFLAREHCDEMQGFLVGRPAAIARYAPIVGDEEPAIRRRAG